MRTATDLRTSKTAQIKTLYYYITAHRRTSTCSSLCSFFIYTAMSFLFIHTFQIQTFLHNLSSNNFIMSFCIRWSSLFKYILRCHFYSHKLIRFFFTYAHPHFTTGCQSTQYVHNTESTQAYHTCLRKTTRTIASEVPCFGLFYKFNVFLEFTFTNFSH